MDIRGEASHILCKLVSWRFEMSQEKQKNTAKFFEIFKIKQHKLISTDFGVATGVFWVGINPISVYQILKKSCAILV